METYVPDGRRRVAVAYLGFYRALGADCLTLYYVPLFSLECDDSWTRSIAAGEGKVAAYFKDMSFDTI